MRHPAETTEVGTLDRMCAWVAGKGDNFWHRHSECRLATTPKTRQDYWLQKFSENTERDRRIESELLDCGWGVMIVWQCEIRHMPALLPRITLFLDGPDDH